MLIVLSMPQDSNEPIVQNCFCARNGFPGLFISKVLDECCFWITLKSNLDINYGSKFAEVFIELGDVVQLLGDLFHLQFGVCVLVLPQEAWLTLIVVPLFSQPRLLCKWPFQTTNSSLSALWFQDYSGDVAIN